MLDCKGLGKLKLLIPIAVILLVATAGFLVLGNFFVEPNATINESADDLQVNVDNTQTSKPTYDQPDINQQTDNPQIQPTPSNNSPDSTSTPSPTQPSTSATIPSSTTAPIPSPSTGISYDTKNKGMIDIVSASIEKDQTAFKVIVQVKDPIQALGSQESAQFDMIVIIETAEEALQTYELIVDMNSTGVFYRVQDVQSETQRPAQLTIDGNTLTITTTLSELKEATQAEWNLFSTYEVMANNQIIYSAYDFVPDEGIKTTVFTSGE